MNLGNLKSKLPLIILFLFVIIGIVIAISIILKPKQTSQENKIGTTLPEGATNIASSPQLEPEELLTNIQEIRKSIIANPISNQQGDLILLQENGMDIKYIPSRDIFLVTIDEDPAETYKKQAQDWFLGFGLKQEDLCNLPVRFILGNFEIRKANHNFTASPDGCN